MRYVVNTTLGPALGRPLDSQAAARAEKVLDSSLATIESVWLEGSGKFLLGSKSPSIADLSLVCEIMQLEVRTLNSINIFLFPFFLDNYFLFSSCCIRPTVMLNFFSGEIHFKS